MAATVVTLGILTFMVPSATTSQEMSSAYSPEAIILGQGELSDEQVLSTLYSGTDEDAVK
jgi:hypothetical protein